MIEIEPTFSNKSTQIEVLLALSCMPGIEHYHAILNPFKSDFMCGNNTSINKQPDGTDKMVLSLKIIMNFTKIFHRWMSLETFEIKIFSPLPHSPGSLFQSYCVSGQERLVHQIN